MGATLSRPHSLDGRGFTLTEILIVIGLIVLVIALAVPAFNAMTGGRSVDAATNQLSAMLGRARMEAIGLQEPRGLLFYRDPATQRVAARMVRTGDAAASGVNLVALDLVRDIDPMLLPVGVGLQVVDDWNSTSPGSSDDRYIGYNAKFGPTQFTVPVGGVILFDQGGRLTSRPYGFIVWNKPDPMKPPVPSEMGRFLYAGSNSTGGPQVLQPPPVGTNFTRSQFGFVLFDEEPFRNKFGTPDDPYADKDPQFGSSNPNELGQTPDKEEGWLDANAVPILINRYNGTLVRGE